MGDIGEPVDGIEVGSAALSVLPLRHTFMRVPDRAIGSRR